MGQPGKRIGIVLLALWSALAGAGCIDWPTVDLAFCEPDEDCWGAPPQVVECDDGVCGEDVLVGVCAKSYACDAQTNRCVVSELLPGRDDSNACTHDVCRDDEWKHDPVTPSEIDDGDPCTFDECNEALGITHANTCS